MKTFRIGGVHPAENKLSAGKAIETLALPKQAVFPLSQHIGAPATAIVKKGDVVKVGTKIAEAGGFVSAAIFSSVSGKVNKVDAIVDASGYRKPAIFIDVEGDEWEESIDRSTTLVKECNLKPEEIVTHYMPFEEAARGYEIFEKREEECRKVILVPGAQSAEAAQKAVSGLVNAMPGGTI